MAPSEFWRLHPQEFWWYYEAKMINSDSVATADKWQELYEALD